VRFEETDLNQLSGLQRAAAINALVSGAALPFVIVGERVVCAGSLDLEVVAAALGQAR
jgi:hypothetical protein